MHKRLQSSFVPKWSARRLAANAPLTFVCATSPLRGDQTWTCADMAAYCDAAQWLRNGERCGHLIADTPEELAAIAEKIELNPRHFNSYAMLPYYSLPVGYQAAATQCGVIALEQPAFLNQVRRISEAWDQRAREPRSTNQHPKKNRLISPNEPALGLPVQPALF